MTSHFKYLGTPFPHLLPLTFSRTNRCLFPSKIGTEALSQFKSPWRPSCKTMNELADRDETFTYIQLQEGTVRSWERPKDLLLQYLIDNF